MSLLSAIYLSRTAQIAFSKDITINGSVFSTLKLKSCARPIFKNSSTLIRQHSLLSTVSPCPIGYNSRNNPICAQSVICKPFSSNISDRIENYGLQPANTDKDHDKDHLQPADDALDNDSCSQEEYETLIRQRILISSLGHVDHFGWTLDAISAGAADIGYPSSVHGMLPGGASDLVIYFDEKCNEDLVSYMKDNKELFSSSSQSDVVKTLLKRRLDLLSCHSSRWSEALAVMTTSGAGLEHLGCIARSCDDIWHFSGDRSVDFSGINTVMYYSATIVQMAGIGDDSTAIWVSAGVASVNFLFTIVGIFLVERVGRRVLAMSSMAGSCVSLCFLAAGFLLMQLFGPTVDVVESGTDPLGCVSLTSCASCIERRGCGFCFVSSDDVISDGSCLPMMDGLHNNYSTYGRCSEKSSHADRALFTIVSCPNEYSLIMIAGLVLYLAFFAPGMGPIPWTVNSEIYPHWARSTGNSLATFANWSSNLLVSMTFLTLVQALSHAGAFWLYATLAAVGLLFIYTTMPETRGLKLEDVDVLFNQPLFSCDKGSQREQYNSLVNVDDDESN